MKTTLAISILLLTAGCSTLPGMKAQVMGANIEIAKQRAQAAAQPVLNASIPVPGCQAPVGTDYKTACVMTIVVHAPQGQGANGQLAMPDDPWARAADRAVGVLGTAAGLYLGGNAAVGLVGAAGNGIAQALRSMPGPVVVQPATPIVVTQPAPIVVNQPAPIVVEQPEPVIVNPVVVNPVVVTVPK